MRAATVTPIELTEQEVADSRNSREETARILDYAHSLFRRGEVDGDVESMLTGVLQWIEEEHKRKTN